MNKKGYTIFAVGFVIVMLIVFAPNFGNDMVNSFDFEEPPIQVEQTESLFDTPVLLEENNKYKHEQIGENTYKYTYYSYRMNNDTKPMQNLDGIQLALVMRQLLTIS